MEIDTLRRDRTCTSRTGQADASMASSRAEVELSEVRQGLRSSQAEKRKGALQHLLSEGIAGRDVSELFADVLRCVQSDSLELKKLVYLYLQRHAETKPEETILVVNMFVQDSKDPSPVVRALAVRTMACVRVPKVAEYLVDPLLQALKDREACVRQAAAMAVPKLYALQPDLAAHSTFLPALKALLNDRSPSVMANAVAALREMEVRSGIVALPRDIEEVTRVFRDSEAVSGWQRAAILDAFGAQRPHSASEARTMVNRVIQDLNHSNSAVVLSAAKILLNQVPHLNDPSMQSMLLEKMRRPLLTIATTSKRNLEYVAMRIIKLIMQKYPGLLHPDDVQVFFCRYNDPPYLKIEKIDVMLMLVAPSNVQALLGELREYAAEVDGSTARKAIWGIGVCAVEIPSVSEACVTILLDLMETDLSYAVQESVTVLKSVLRRYPGTFDHVVPAVANKMDQVEEPKARAAAVWMIGDASDRLPHAEELLENFVQGFAAEKAAVQLQILTSTVKLFLKGHGTRTRDTVHKLLENVTESAANPDLRDRAFFYWRLLSRPDLTMANQVVLAQHPPASGMAIVEVVEPLLSELIGCIPNLSSVYHRSAASFVKAVDPASFESVVSEPSGVSQKSESTTSTSHTAQKHHFLQEDMLKDLYSLQVNAPPDGPSPADKFESFSEMQGWESLQGPSEPQHDFPAQAPPHQTVNEQQTLPLLIDAVQGRGLQVFGQFEGHPLTEGGITYHLRLENHTDIPMDGFYIQLDKNSLGLVPQTVRLDISSLEAQHSAELWHPILQTNAVSAMGEMQELQAALKTNQTGVLYFMSQLPSF